MAQRRMFSLKIVDSAKFLKMPSSTRLLYYDLCMRADDDGVVEGFNVLRMTGATEDDLKVLVTKEFIKVLNNDLVSYVLDWREHNKIRADRKVDSIYKDLLLQVLPTTKLLEPRKRADLKANDNNINNMDRNWTSTGQSTDGLGKDRLGKVSLGQSSIGQDRIEENSLTNSTSILSFPTEIHKLLFNQFGNVTYETWFMDSIIKVDGNLIKIEVDSQFKKDLIAEKFIKIIGNLTHKKVSIKIKGDELIG